MERNRRIRDLLGRSDMDRLSKNCMVVALVDPHISCSLRRLFDGGCHELKNKAIVEFSRKYLL